MKSTTLSNKTIVEQLNANFYVATLNAEEKKPLLFNGRKFVYKPNGHKTGIHELADALATVDGSVAYPTLCFLNADYEIVFQTTNYLDASAMGKLLDLLQKQWLKASK